MEKDTISYNQKRSIAATKGLQIVRNTKIFELAPCGIISTCSIRSDILIQQLIWRWLSRLRRSRGGHPIGSSIAHPTVIVSRCVARIGHSSFVVRWRNGLEIIQFKTIKSKDFIMEFIRKNTTYRLDKLSEKELQRVGFKII